MAKEEKLVSMSLGEHLEDLRYRLMMAVSGAICGFIVCLFAGKSIMRLIIMPYRKSMEAAGMNPQLQAILPSEQFIVYIKCALVFGIILVAPVIFYHLWKFISPGLYKKETKFVYMVVPTSAVLFMTGCIFFITVVAPMALTFFIKFDTGVDFVVVNLTLSSYVNFVLTLSLVFGAAFQMPIGIIFAEQLGLVTIEALAKGRKITIMVIIIAAAIVTPPDVISQVALALPMYMLYESSIAVCWILRKRKQKKQQAI